MESKTEEKLPRMKSEQIVLLVKSSENGIAEDRKQKSRKKERDRKRLVECRTRRNTKQH